ncbi:BTB/POZ domain-containing adapter for CUL3-mediated RhoA degradation protein 3-like [Brevipalpus obovatus]|uniref:BTB/POZ domain-containing adapter for CUL3-mediated RhoA degradation protein 3-like n=1 Tax=Brevipalpus obovatus TaxID=246614 RepID=UPI003D9DFF68
MASSDSIVSSVVKYYDQLGEYVKLNVGGSLFHTTMRTLTRCDSNIRTLLSDKSVRRIDAEGYMLIDRGGKHFEKILNFLRDGSVPLPDTRMELEELLVEAKFYQIQELIDRIETKISSLEKPFPDQCVVELAKKVVIFTHVDDETDLENVTKRLSKMTGLCLRTNPLRKFSGESASNLLRNFELFERLLKAHGKEILFLKDSKSGDSCKWCTIVDGKCTKIIACDKDEKIQYKGMDVISELTRIYIDHYMD